MKRLFLSIYVAAIIASFPIFGQAQNSSSIPHLLKQGTATQYYIAGSGVVVTFQSSSNDGMIAGIASIDEGTFVNGKWITGRRLMEMKIIKEGICICPEESTVSRK